MKSIDSMLKIRTNINDIDKKIINLIKKRESLSIEIAKIKQYNKIEIRDIKREKELFDDIKKIAEEKKIDINFINKVFKLIVYHSVSIQKLFIKNDRLNKIKKFFYLGPKGSYSNIATKKYAKNHFKNYIEYECNDFLEVIKKTENHQNSYAVLPIENTCSGSIHEVYNILQNTNLFIIQEIEVQIKHCLLALKNTEIKDINTIYTHPQPFIQCNQFIKKYPHWKIKYTKSSTDAIKYILKKQDKQFAVLGNEYSGKLYQLNVLKKNISNKLNNITNFIILHKNIKKMSNQNDIKTILLIHINKDPNYLTKLLSILKNQNLKVDKLICQPNCNNETINVVYITIAKNLWSINMENIINSLHGTIKSIKILGCYKNRNNKFK